MSLSELGQGSREVFPNGNGDLSVRKYVDLVENTYPHILVEREGFDPEVSVGNFTDLKLGVNEEALRLYVKNMRFVDWVGDGIVFLPVYDRLSAVRLEIQEELPDASGRAILSFDQFTIKIGSAGDLDLFRKDYSEFLWSDYAIGLIHNLSEFQYHWMENFLDSLDSENIKHHEAMMNLICLHEIKHLEHLFQHRFSMYKACKEVLENSSEDEHLLRLMDVEQKYRVAYGTSRESVSEAYAWANLRRMQHGKCPKIITMQD